MAASTTHWPIHRKESLVLADCGSAEVVTALDPQPTFSQAAILTKVSIRRRLIQQRNWVAILVPSAPEVRLSETTRRPRRLGLTSHNTFLGSKQVFSQLPTTGLPRIDLPVPINKLVDCMTMAPRGTLGQERLLMTAAFAMSRSGNADRIFVYARWERNIAVTDCPIRPRIENWSDLGAS